MTVNQWPGPHEKQVIVEMLENRDSTHWEKCSELMKWLILKETGKYSTPFPTDLVDEIVQNAMLSVVINLPNFRFESKLTTWLMPIARTRTIDALRTGSKVNRITPLQNHSKEDEENEIITYEHEILRPLEDELLPDIIRLYRLPAVQSYQPLLLHASKPGFLRLQTGNFCNFADVPQAWDTSFLLPRFPTIRLFQHRLECLAGCALSQKCLKVVKSTSQSVPQ